MIDRRRVRPTGEDLILLVPIFNDWTALARFLDQLDSIVVRRDLQVGVLVVDDGSTDPIPEALVNRWAGLHRIEVLELRRNLGHQRAIAVALAHVAEERPGLPLVIMDGDGEDLPSELPKLLEKYREEDGTKIVFAERTRRTEGLLFRISYWLYRVVHRALTGRGIKVGNYSVVPPRLLQRLVVLSELWNHYAAAVFKGRIPFTTVPTSRGRRLDGKSHMNFVGLVVHGLSAISVYNETVSVRLLTAAGSVMALASSLLVATVIIRLGTDLAVPGWATYTSGLLLVLLFLSLLMAFLLVFILLSSRSNLSFLPIRDYHFFVADLRELPRS